MDWIRRNFDLKVIALVAAVVLWFIFNRLSASQASTKTLEVPLAVHGVASGLVANVGIQQVAVEIAGTRSALEDVAPGDFVAYVDCSGKGAGTFGLPVTVVAAQNQRPVSVTPATAIVVLEVYAYRRVPVIADPSGAAAAVGEIDPATVVVAGGQSEVSRVFAAEASIPAAAVTKPVSVTVKPIPVDTRLTAVQGVTLAPASVRIAIAPRKFNG
jgi:YbbR domain-containing protein